MSDRVTAITARLQEIDADVSDSFGSLSPDQLNWRPTENAWSVGQCIEHLIKTNSEMLPAMDAKIAGSSNSFWEQWSPLTGYFGRYLMNAMPADGKRHKAPSKKIVPPSGISPDVVARFTDLQRVMIEKIVALDALDWDRTIITSPFLGLMTYRLSDGIEILVEHEKRHVRQAKRVMEAAGFPSALAVV